MKMFSFFLLYTHSDTCWLFGHMTYCYVSLHDFVVVDVNHVVTEDDVGHEMTELNPAYVGWV